MTNVFNRTISITLYEVDVATDGSVVKREPEEKLEYAVTPLNLESIDSIEQWARQQVLDKFITALRTTTGTTNEEFLSLLAEETKRLSELGWASKDVAKELYTLRGSAFIIWKCLTGPKQSYEDLCIRLMLKENQDEVWHTIRRLDTLDSHGVSHPFQAQSLGQIKTATKIMQMKQYFTRD